MILSRTRTASLIVDGLLARSIRGMFLRELHPRGLEESKRQSPDFGSATKTFHDAYDSGPEKSEPSVSFQRQRKPGIITRDSSLGITD